jgi:putative tricarboxylic transport membrane protein
MWNQSLLRNSSFLAGIFAILIGLAWGMGSLFMRDAALGNPNAPRYFPWLVSALAVVAGIVLVAREITHPTAGKPLKFEFDSTYRAALIGSVLGFVYAQIFEEAGFIPSTIVFVGGVSFAYNGFSRWKTNIITAVLFSIAVYFIFTALGKPLVAFPQF